MDPDLAEEIRLLLSPRLQLHETWSLRYSLEQHGVSLSTLYDRTRAAGAGTGGGGGYVLAVRDSVDGVSRPPIPRSERVDS